MGGERDGEGWGGKGREERRAREEGKVERRGGDAVLGCVHCSICQLSSPAEPDPGGSRREVGASMESASVASPTVGVRASSSRL